MSSNLNIRAKYDQLKTLGFAAIGAAWTGIVDMAGAPSATDHPARIYHIVNNTDADLFFSWDADKPFVLLPAGRSFSEDLCANQALTSGFALPEGSRLYVKHNGVAPTTKAIWLTVCYASSY
jgi:hypothetical protein